MNTVCTSVIKNRNVLFAVFLKSLYYTFPFGMFVVACNCLFESVKNYYFDWMIVVLPTIVVCVVTSLYEMFVIYQERGFLFKRENTFASKQSGYSMSNANLSRG